MTAREHLHSLNFIPPCKHEHERELSSSLPLMIVFIASRSSCLARETSTTGGALCVLVCVHHAPSREDGDGEDKEEEDSSRLEQLSDTIHTAFVYTSCESYIRIMSSIEKVRLSHTYHITPCEDGDGDGDGWRWRWMECLSPYYYYSSLRDRKTIRNR